MMQALVQKVLDAGYASAGDSDCESIIKRLQRETVDATKREDVLRVLEGRWEDLEAEWMCGDDGSRALLLGALILCARRPLPAQEVMGLSREGKDVGKQVGRAVVPLVQLASNGDLSLPVRGYALQSLVGLALPSAYFQEEGKCENDTPISNLTKRYNNAVNAIISLTLERRLLACLSKSLSLLTDRERQASATTALLDSALHLVRILLQNSSQHYAKLRKHLGSKACVDFVPGVVLPRLQSLVELIALNQKSRAGQSGGPADSVQLTKSLIAVLSVMTVVTFKVKSMREQCFQAKEDPLGRILGFEEATSCNPQILSLLCKLHVNMLGGFGPTWKSHHKRFVSKLRQKVESMKRLKNKSILKEFARCMHSRLVPVDRKSRAYPALAFAWRIGNELDEHMPVLITSQPRRADETKLGEPAGESDVSPASNGYANAARIPSKIEDSNSTSKVQERFESLSMPSASSTQCTSREGKTPRVETELLSSSLELDELDSLLLGFDRGPPPARFLCGLTGELMSDPIRHPRGDVWVERSALETYSNHALEETTQSCDAQNCGLTSIRWPGGTNEVYFSVEAIDNLATDEQLQQDILRWRLRQERIR